MSARAMVLAAVTVLVSCAPAPTAQEAPEAFTGTWAGRMPGAAEIRVHITHPAGQDFTGCVRVDFLGRGTYVGAPIAGFRDADAVTMATTDGTALVWTFTGRLEGDLLTGTAVGERWAVLSDGSHQLTEWGRGQVAMSRAQHGDDCGAGA